MGVFGPVLRNCATLLLSSFHLLVQRSVAKSTIAKPSKAIVASPGVPPSMGAAISGTATIIARTRPTSLLWTACSSHVILLLLLLLLFIDAISVSPMV